MKPSKKNLGARGRDVTFELPDHAPTRLPASEAAALMVAAYGERARDQEITGACSAFFAYWDEVDRLLAEREGDDAGGSPCTA